MGSRADRKLRVIDATCPLVTKVHLEVERYARENRTVILVGHAGHEEVKGTLGVAPGRVLLVGSVRRPRRLEVPDPERVAAVTQTTLSVDDTREIMETLKRRFPGDGRAQDRRHLLRDAEPPERGQRAGRPGDAILVVGSRQSSNANRMVEVARMRGATRFSGRFAGRRRPDDARRRARARLTASASSPEWLVEQIIGAFCE